MTIAIQKRVVELLATHAARYPALCVIDAYKLLYQACMGPGHAQGDPGVMWRRLRAEYDSVSASPEAALLEDITLHSPLYRLHLAAAKARGIDPEIVLDRFMSCMTAFPSRVDLLPLMWAVLCREIRASRLSVADADGLDFADGHLRSRGFPLVSHSLAFRRAYAPAYRLVDASALLLEALR